VDIDTEEGARPITMDARSLTLPSVAIIAVVFASMSLTYFLAAERSRLDNRIDTVVTSVERLAVSISQLADGLRFSTADRFTMTHHHLWCAKAEIANKGFKCPEVSNSTVPTTGARLNQTLEGVTNEMGAIVEKVGQVKKDK